MKKKVAEIISLVLNPVFVSLLLILIGIEKSQLSQSYLILFTIFALSLNGLLPLLLLVYFTKKKIVLDDVLENKEVLKNRPFFLAWAAIILFLETVILYFFNKPQPLLAILLSIFFLTLSLFLVSLYRKISLHVAQMTAFSVTVLFLFGLPFWPVLFFIFLIIWSRLILRRHTKKQILAAFFLALFIPTLIFYLYGFLSF